MASNAKKRSENRIPISLLVVSESVRRSWSLGQNVPDNDSCCYHPNLQLLLISVILVVGQAPVIFCSRWHGACRNCLLSYWSLRIWNLVSPCHWVYISRHHLMLKVSLLRSELCNVLFHQVLLPSVPDVPDLCIFFHH